MTELERIDKVINDLYSIRDVALSVFGDEGYFALDDSIRSLQKTWSICKRGQEEKLKNAYHTPVNNSKKPIKSSARDDFANRLNKLMKHYSLSFSSGSLEDNMIDIYDNYVSQYYDDELKQKGGAAVADDWFHNTYSDDEEGIFIQNSCKLIKSSLDDRLVPYLEEFEEGYADAINKDAWNEDVNNVNQDTFFEIFMSDHNLTRSDIENLKNAVGNIWDETDEEIEHDMGEMYGAPHGATSEEALKVFESKKPIKSGSMSGYFSGICDKCKQFTNVHYVGYNGRKLCMRCSRGR